MMKMIILVLLLAIVETAVELIKIFFTKYFRPEDIPEQQYNKRTKIIGTVFILANIIMALFKYVSPYIEASAVDDPVYNFEDDKIISDEVPDLIITSDNCSIEDVILISGIHLYTSEELMDFSRDELRLIRNGIFALNGRAFVEEDLHNYYSQFDWYNPLPSGTVVDYSSLNEKQRKNIDCIKDVETYKRKFNLK